MSDPKKFWPQTLSEFRVGIPVNELDVTKPPYNMTRYRSIDAATKAAVEEGVPLFRDDFLLRGQHD